MHKTLVPDDAWNKECITKWGIYLRCAEAKSKEQQMRPGRKG